MNDPFDDIDNPESGDIVDDFFARQRELIEPSSGSDLHWQSIVRQARVDTPRRRASRAFLGTIAAGVAAVLAIFAVWTWQRQPLSAPNLRAGQSVSQATDGSVGNPSQTEDPGQPQLPQSVPAGFRTWSVSNAGGGTVYNLGSTECGSDICPTLLRSTPDGGSWSAVHIFSGTDTSSATGGDVPMIQPDRAISQVRMVDAQVGYVFGGDLWVTTDRGASFTRVNHPGQTVLDLEIWEGEILLLSADGCVQGTCVGPMYLSTTDRSNANSFTAIDSATIPSIDDASLVVKGALVMVQTMRNNRATQQPWILDGTDLKAITGPAACGRHPLEAVTVTADTASTLMALCRVDSASSSFRVLTSTNNGTSWTVVSTGALQLPAIGQLSLAAADARHLVAAAGGPRGGSSATGADAGRSLQVSSDGGVTWHPAKQPEPAPVNGFDWAASPGGAEFYAVPRTTPGFWASKDFGATWTVVLPTS